MGISDAVARWCPTLDPNYGTTTLTDLIGGVGDFTLPTSANWGEASSLRHLNWSNNWHTVITPGPMQRSNENWSFSLWMNWSSGLPWSALLSTSNNWSGWYGSGGVGFASPSNNNFDDSFNVSLPGVSGWRHVVYRNQASTAIFVSVNGEHSRPSSSIRNFTSGVFRLALGASVRSGVTADNYFRGQQDDWIFYDRFLSDAEIETIYARGRGADLSISESPRRRRSRGRYAAL
jgi:hypothetical protein